MRHIRVGEFKTNSQMRLYLDHVLATGRLSYGEMSQQLEKEFAEMHGCKYGVLSNSGTSSLQVALQTLKELNGWKDGDEVIVPALTFVATVNIVLHNRMTPVLVDIDPMYYELDETRVEEAVTDRTRAIIPVHLFGQPCNMHILQAIAVEHDLKIIEDSCEAMQVRYGNNSVGSWGDIGCFSTYIAHILTSGVGGIAATNNPDYAAKMRSLVNHGRDGIYFDSFYADPKELMARRFNFESIGHSYRITELEAAIALAQLPDLKNIIAKRNENADYLTQGLKHLAEHLQLPERRLHAEHSWMMYPIVLLDPGDKWEFLNYLEESGIETREMLPLTNQPCYKGMFNEFDYPIAAWINRFGFYIGCHQYLTQEDLDYVIEKFDNYFGAVDDTRRFESGISNSARDGGGQRVLEGQMQAVARKDS